MSNEARGIFNKGYYKNKYGEWEARAGSEYGDETNPALYIPKEQWGSTPKRILKNEIFKEPVKVEY